MKSESVLVKKSTGELVPFSEEKLANSLKRSGANDENIRQVLEDIRGKIFSGIHSKDIYKLAFKSLKKAKGPHAGKYKLKYAIMEIGPSGFPFEKFLGAILNEMGYTTEVDLILQGHCVSHEVDIIARKGNSLVMVECKFHRNRAHHCDVKVPLYINSRFADIVESWTLKPVYPEKEFRGWVVTNTKFTADAIQYAECRGLHLIGWSYPETGSLRDMIDSTRLFPITCMSTLTRDEKDKLLGEGVVLCRDIVSNPKVLSSLRINEKRISVITNEAIQLGRV